MATDDFNRANAGNLGANWGIVAVDDGPTGFTIASNEARTSGALCANYYSAETFDVDHWSETTLGSVLDSADSAGGVGPAWRMSGSSALATTSFYYARASNNAINEIHYGKMVNGTLTPISTNNTGPTPSTGYVLRGGGEGTTQRVYVGGSELFTFTDSSLTTQIRAGIDGEPQNSFGTINSWEAGDFVVVSPPMFRGS